MTLLLKPTPKNTVCPKSIRNNEHNQSHLTQPNPTLPNLTQSYPIVPNLTQVNLTQPNPT